MFALSGKLAILVLVAPIVILAILDAVSFYFYGTLVIEFSNFLSSILVFLLVWERLRESLSKKLEYLHKSYMELSSAYHLDFLYFRNYKDKVKGIMTDFKTHGKFLRISLYPCCLNKIDKLLSLNTKIEEALDVVEDIAKKELKPYHYDLWRHLIAIKELEQDELRRYTTMASFPLYEQKAQTVKKEQAELLTELKSLGSETEKLKKELLGELQEFLKSNNLSLEPKY